MFSVHCNIDKTDRMNRAVIGLVILIAALIGFAKWFFILVGSVLIIEGVIGWCYIPTLIYKAKQRVDSRKKQ